MTLEGIKAYWQLWVSKGTKGDPFSLLSGKEKEGEQEQEDSEENKNEGGDEGENQVQDQDQDQEEEEEETHSRTKKAPTRPPISPTPECDLDIGIPLPYQCDTPAMRTTCLQQLAPKWGSAGKEFNLVVGLVDALEVSSAPIIEFLSYLISFQDTDTPSGFQNSKWPFIKWSWDSVHLSRETHQNHRSLDGFLDWLDQKASGLSKQTPLNKNKLQGLLLGVGLCQGHSTQDAPNAVSEVLGASASSVQSNWCFLVG